MNLREKRKINDYLREMRNYLDRLLVDFLHKFDISISLEHRKLILAVAFVICFLGYSLVMQRGPYFYRIFSFRGYIWFWKQCFCLFSIFLPAGVFFWFVVVPKIYKRINQYFSDSDITRTVSFTSTESLSASMPPSGTNNRTLRIMLLSVLAIAYISIAGFAAIRCHKEEIYWRADSGFGVNKMDMLENRSYLTTLGITTRADYLYTAYSGEYWKYCASQLVNGISAGTLGAIGAGVESFMQRNELSTNLLTTNDNWFIINLTVNLINAIHDGVFISLWGGFAHYDLCPYKTYDEKAVKSLWNERHNNK